MNLKDWIAAASCWALREQFSPLDLFYSVVIGLTWHEFGFLSAESFAAFVLAILFHVTFRIVTAKIRIAHLFRKIESFNLKNK